MSHDILPFCFTVDSMSICLWYGHPCACVTHLSVLTAACTVQSTCMHLLDAVVCALTLLCVAAGDGNCGYRGVMIGLIEGAHASATFKQWMLQLLPKALGAIRRHGFAKGEEGAQTCPINQGFNQLMVCYLCCYCFYYDGDVQGVSDPAPGETICIAWCCMACNDKMQLAVLTVLGLDMSG